MKKMRYLLNEEYSLRSFIGVPCCYYEKGTVKAHSLTKEEFDFLLLCDGTHMIGDDTFPTVRVRKMVRAANEGEILSEHQRYRHCENRYFPAINWMITARCNYNCLHCFNASGLSPSAAEWSYENAEILMDEALRCGVHAFTLTGGEPMLHPRFMDIVRGIYTRGMFVNELNTNGAFITGTALDTFREIGADPLLKISFDGLGAHDYLRNSAGAEEKTIEAVRLSIAEGFAVKVQCSVHRGNIRTIYETLCFLENMGVKETRLIRTSESPRWEKLGRGKTLSFREYYGEMLSFSEQWLKEPHTMKVTIWHMDTLPYITQGSGGMDSSREESEWDSLARYRRKAYACPDARFLAAVTAEGDLVPCLQVSGRFSRDGTHLNNVMGGGLQKLLKESAYLDTVCFTLGELADSNASCGNCGHFLDCMGGCRAIALISTGDYRGTDRARCIYFKEGYAARMKELVLRALHSG